MRRLKLIMLALLICLILMVPMLNSCSPVQTQSTGLGFYAPRGEEAEQRISQFLGKIRPLSNLAQAHYRLGHFYLRQRKYALAAESFGRAVRADADNVRAYNGLAIAHDALGEYELAKAAYEAAISLTPADGALYNNLGCSFLRQNKLETARAAFRRAVALAGDSSRIKNNLALTEARLAGLAATPGTPVIAEPGEEPAPILADAELAPEEPLDTPAAPVHPRHVSVGAVQLTNAALLGIGETAAEVTEPVAEVGGERRSDSSAAVSPPSPPGPAPDLSGLVVEVSNGNGVSGMARRSATYFRDQGLPVRRLTNAEHFGFPETQIFCKKGYLLEAYSLANLVPGYQNVESRDTLGRPEIQVKIILGRDLAAFHFPAPATGQLVAEAAAAATTAAPAALLAGGRTSTHP